MTRSVIPNDGNGSEDVRGEIRKVGVFTQFLDNPTVMPNTLAQQIFSIVPGIAGGIAGFILAGKLANTPKVKTSGVLVAAVANALLTLATIFLITAAEGEEVEEIEEGSA